MGGAQPGDVVAGRSGSDVLGAHTGLPCIPAGGRPVWRSKDGDVDRGRSPRLPGRRRGRVGLAESRPGVDQRGRSVFRARLHPADGGRHRTPGTVGSGNRGGSVTQRVGDRPRGRRCRCRGGRAGNPGLGTGGLGSDRRRLRAPRRVRGAGGRRGVRRNGVTGMGAVPHGVGLHGGGRLQTCRAVEPRPSLLVDDVARPALLRGVPYGLRRAVGNRWRLVVGGAGTAERDGRRSRDPARVCRRDCGPARPAPAPAGRRGRGTSPVGVGAAAAAGDPGTR